MTTSEYPRLRSWRRVLGLALWVLGVLGVTMPISAEETRAPTEGAYDLLCYWPNIGPGCDDMASTHYLRTDPSCPQIPAGVTHDNWYVHLKLGAPDATGFVWMTRRDGPKGGNAYQFWVYDAWALYVISEFGDFKSAPGAPKGTWWGTWPGAIGFGALAPRYPADGTHLEQTRWEFAIDAAFDPAGQNPPTGLTAYSGQSTTSIDAGPHTTCHGDARLRSTAGPTDRGWTEKAYVGDFVPICGTKDYRRGLHRWERYDNDDPDSTPPWQPHTAQSCHAINGVWYGPPQGCMTGRRDYCWEPLRDGK